MRWTSKIGVGGSILTCAALTLAIAAPASATGPRTAPAPAAPAATLTNVVAADGAVDIVWRADDPVPYVVEQGGDVLRLAADGTLTSALVPGRHRQRRRRAGSARPHVHRRRRPRLRRLHRPRRQHQHRRAPGARRRHARPGPDANAPRDRPAVRQPQRWRRGRSDPTGCSTSAWATAGRAAIPNGGRSTSARCSASSCASIRRRRPTSAYTIPPDNPLRRNRRRPRRDLVDGAAQPVALLVRLGHWRPVDRRRRPERHRGGRRGRGHRRARRRQGGRLRVERVRGQRSLQRRPVRARPPPADLHLPARPALLDLRWRRAPVAPARGRSTGGTCSATTARAR